MSITRLLVVTVALGLILSAVYAYADSLQGSKSTSFEQQMTADPSLAAQPVVPASSAVENSQPSKASSKKHDDWAWGLALAPLAFIGGGGCDAPAAALDASKNQLPGNGDNGPPNAACATWRHGDHPRFGHWYWGHRHDHSHDSQVPEPGSMILLAAGLGALVLWRKRR
jgi:hypothetical protein